MKILELTVRDDYDTEEVGEIVKADPALTGRILKLANSADLAARQPASTVTEAIVRLGAHRVRDLVLAFSLLAERRQRVCGPFDFDRYWAKSLARAVICEFIASRGREIPSQEAYVCGLLAGIGRLALSNVYPDKYADILSRLPMSFEEMLTEERECFGIDHIEIAACMMGEWRLPESYMQAVRRYHYPCELAADARVENDLGAILHYSEILAELAVGSDVAAPDYGVERSEAVLFSVASLLGMDEREDFQQFFDACMISWNSWGADVGIPTDSSLRLDVVLENLKAAESSGGSSPKPEQQETAQATGAPEPERDHDQFTLLAVDDEPVQRFLMKKHLENLGYHLTVVDSGAKALRVAFETLPDIVIADWMMPGMDGLELCRQLRRTDAGQKIYFILLTGKEAEEDIVQAFEDGVDDYVTKPFNPRLLSARIKAGERVVALQRQVEEDHRTMGLQFADLSSLSCKLRMASLTDPLTSLHNRRFAMSQLETEWESMERTGRPFSVIMCDIDFFKKVNDTHGHDVGDVVLKSTSEMMQTTIRKSEFACRLGGEEFLIICPNTPTDGILHVAERLRVAVEKNIMETGDLTLGITISLGVATTGPGIADIDALLKIADLGVYAAKDSGRNKTCSVGGAVEQKKSA